MAVETVTTALESLPLRDSDRGRRNLAALAGHLGPSGLAGLASPLARALSRNADPDMALNNLERLLAGRVAREHLPSLLDGRGRGFDTLLSLLGTSQFLADVLASDPSALDALRGPLRRSPAFADLHDQLAAEVAAAPDDAGVLRAVRRFRQRQTVRIGAADIIRDRPLDDITRDLSRVAEVVIEVALAHALRQLTARYGEPDARVVVLAFGKLGGAELNYSSDIDLMFVYDHDGSTRGRRSISAEEYFTRAVGEVVRLLSASTAYGLAYRVDMRLRPEGPRGPLARTFASTLSYYDVVGRTWERQALIKARPVAGDLVLGKEFLQAVEPFVYRKYFSFSEINDVKAMKRRIERKATAAGADDNEVKTGRGGIRDIEFAVQFLQLLNGGDLPEVRQRNTLAAIQSLAAAGCLTDQEAVILDDTYRFLRKAEHRLQLLFDLQTHRLPDPPDELRKLARRMGYGDRGQKADDRRWKTEDNRAANQAFSTDNEPDRSSSVHSSPQSRRPVGLEDLPEAHLETRDLLIDPLDRFLHDYQAKTRLNRTILDHLLHQSFEGDAEDAQSAPESDLILDPQPDDATIQAVLGRYPFRDVRGAYQNLALLARESVRFLSERRCRHFLASLAPRLLRAVAATPDPDQTLTNLEKVTASLGAKAVLYELFSFNPPSLRLYVDLCSGSQFLSEVLVNNPGMIDELLDTLVLNRPRSAEELRAELAALCQGAADVEPILHSFQDKELLRIGVADLLGKAPIAETTAGLSDLAETILSRVVALQESRLADRFGRPTLDDGRLCRFAVLALGKLGGRELSYHSDLDLMVVYEGEGYTIADGGGESAENSHFFAELARRLIKVIGTLGPSGRLYHIDMRLRPEGESGSLAVSLPEFVRYYAGGGGQLWERQALTKSRAVAGEPEFATQVEEAARRATFDQPWNSMCVGEIVSMRERLEASRGARDLKRGWGGLADVEFLVQMFQLEHGATTPALRTPNTRTALNALLDAGFLTADDHSALREAYDFLRLVESRLRLVTNRAADALPEPADDLAKLARRLGYDPASGPPGDCFLADFDAQTCRTRAIFRRLFERERARATAATPS